MASARVEHMLNEISQLSREEQAELMRALPRVLQQGHGAHSSSSLTVDVVQRAIETRERIRARLSSAQVSPGSINVDLDDIRDERLNELLGGHATKNQAQ